MKLPALVAVVALSLTATALARRAAHAAGPGSAALIVQIAQRELARDVHEVPDGSNRSPDIRRYDSATVGSEYGAPWCAYFASYVAKHAGVPIGYRGEGIGYVPYIRQWARATGRLRRTPKPGYLITFPEHVGIVEHVYSNHTLSSIEGNAGNAVRREYHGWSEAVAYVKVAADDGAGVQSPNQPHPPATSVSGRLRARIHAYPSGDVAVGDNVDFTSQDSSGNPVRETWSFGEHKGVDARGPNASHAYAHAGVYTVTLRMRDRRGHRSSASAVVTVRDAQPPQPELSLDSDTIHPGETVGMDGSGSSDPNGDVAKYEWDFVGNGDFVEGGDHASHRYTQPGAYTVRLRVTDDRGLQSETERTLTVEPWEPPVASIDCSSPEVAAGQTIDCSSDDSGSPYAVVRHEWDVGGAYTLRGHDVSFSYPHPGRYRIHLHVTDVHGDSADADAYVTVDDVAPTATLVAPAALDLNAPATFDGSRSSDPDGQVVRYEWDAGTGGGYEPGGSSFTYTYARPGWYDVSLRVTDDGGLTDETDTWIRIEDRAPVAQMTATPTSLVHGSAATFDGSRSSDPDAGDGIARWEWDFRGNGSWVTGGPSARYTYASAGTYYAKLRVTDRYGTTSTAQVRISVG